MSRLLRKIGFRQCPKHGWVWPIGGRANQRVRQCPVCFQWAS